MWSQSGMIAGGTVASRAFDFVLLRKDCIHKLVDGSYVANGMHYCTDGTPNIILYTNTSDRIPFRLNDGVVL